MTAIDTTFLKPGAAIASPADYPDSPLSQALWQPVLEGLFLPMLRLSLTMPIASRSLDVPASPAMHMPIVPCFYLHLCKSYR